MSPRPLLGLTREGKPVSYPGDGHILTVSRPGGGKDRCIIAPNLVRSGNVPVVVVDPKGEQTALTSAWRSQFQPIHVFDPYRVTGMPCSSFNPIDMIRARATPLSDAFMIAEALIIPDQHQAHWGQAAQAFLAALILYIALDPLFDEMPHLRTMKSVWRTFANAEMQAHALARMAESENEFIADQALAFQTGGEGGGNENEMKSVRNSLRTQCGRLFGEPAIVDSMETTSLDFGTLSRQPATVYIVLPGSLASVHSRYIRLLVSCALCQIERAGLVDWRERPPITFYVNEFYTLGPYPTLIEAMGRMRGHGCRFWIFCQTLAQLRHLYHDGWDIIPGTAGVLQYFGGTNCVFTSEYLSKLSGEMTQVVRSLSESTNIQAGVGTNYNLAGRPMLFPGQVRSLPDGEQLLLIAGEGPARIGMAYRDRDFPEFSSFLAQMSQGVAE